MAEKGDVLFERCGGDGVTKGPLCTTDRGLRRRLRPLVRSTVSPDMQAFVQGHAAGTLSISRSMGHHSSQGKGFVYTFPTTDVLLWYPEHSFDLLYITTCARSLELP